MLAIGIIFSICLIIYLRKFIIVNNFIDNELENVKVVYINEKSEKRKLKGIISKFYKKINDKSFYTEWLNEKIINDYKNKQTAFCA